MSSTNKTAELQLSQFIGTDIPSILTDYNGDMQKIDAGVREVKQATAGAVSDLSSVTARVTNAEQDISGLNTTVQGIATRVVSVESLIPNTASSSNKLATSQDVANSRGYNHSFTPADLSNKKTAIAELYNYISNLDDAQKATCILVWGNEILRPANKGATAFQNSVTTPITYGDISSQTGVVNVSGTRVALSATEANMKFDFFNYRVAVAGITFMEVTNSIDDVIGGTPILYHI